MMTDQEPRPSKRPSYPTDPTLRNWGEALTGENGGKLREKVILDCGWGRLIFAHTFSDHDDLSQALRRERKGRRDVAFYVREPHVAVAQAPQELFLDPSHTFRLWSDHYTPGRSAEGYIEIRPVETRQDVKAVNAILSNLGMVEMDADLILATGDGSALNFFVAEDKTTGTVVGGAMGVDHKEAFDDPENGSSLWSLGVGPAAQSPGIGEALVRYLAEFFFAKGRSFMDLSVMHDNVNAIRLYKKLGFEQIPVYAIKRKNPINEKLYIGPAPEAALNPYARIIINEARRRGIVVEVIDEKEGFFELSFGGRTVACRESLSELTSAVAMSLCADKAVTRRVLKQSGLRVPSQMPAGTPDENASFLKIHKSVVVKPAMGEQGAGISVDLRTPEEIEAAVAYADDNGGHPLLEEYVTGVDLRIVVIGYEVVAAAVRHPAQVQGDGRHTVAELIEKQSRRRAAATGGESRIPVDDETHRCVRDAGFEMDDVPPAGTNFAVRKTANLHTGGTLEDVTESLHPALAAAAVGAAKAINIPVTGLDFIVPSPEVSDYRIIEANERPGLANHEPQPTAERFIDLLFPQTAVPEGPTLPAT